MYRRSYLLFVIFLVSNLLLVSCSNSGSQDPTGKTFPPPGSTTADSGGEATEPNQDKVDTELTVSDFTPPTGAVKGPGELGPWNKRLLIATSREGNKFKTTGLKITDQGDVPSMVTTIDGTIFLYYTGWTVGLEQNKTVVAISQDNGLSWTYKKLVLAGFDDLSEPVDPAVIIDDDVFRLFLTADSGDGPATHYAESRDGIHFQYKGVAFKVEDKPVIDPSIIKIGETWHLYAGGVPNINWHAISNNGRSFEPAGPLKFEIEKDRFYAFANGVNAPTVNVFYAYSGETIRSYRSSNGNDWKLEFNNSFPVGSDPAVTILRDGTYLMVYTSRIDND